ncbi:MAG: ABC transporter ATP-binding protein [Thermomonas sp.]
MSYDNARSPQGEADLALRDVAVSLRGISKNYHIYDRPQDRLRQVLFPRLSRLARRKSREYFREFHALRDIDLQIQRGETIGIVGRNGSGKSTLLQILCGTLAPTTGEVRVAGRVGALLELGSGFNPEFTGRENVYLNATVLGMSRDEVDARFADIIAFADIGDFIDQPVKTYSSGMYVRLAFAVIAHAEADVLVIDEALSVGDVFFGQKCMRFLRRFQETGTVIFVSHDAAAVTNLCDRAVLLDHGRMIMDGPAKQVMEAYHATLYGQQVRAVKVDDSLKVGELPPPVAPVRPQISEVEVFNFSPATGFGDGTASVTNVVLIDRSGNELSWIRGGELVKLRIEAIAHEGIDSPIVGFHFKDRLGQVLFGDNTWNKIEGEQAGLAAGDSFLAEFEFVMPILPIGKYSLDIAVADGTQHAHRQALWAHDAMIVESHSSSVSTGLVGIPFRSIRLQRTTVMD